MSTISFRRSRQTNQQKLLMGNHRPKRAKNAGILFLSATHTTRTAGTRTSPNYRKSEDVHLGLQAIWFKTQTTSTAI
jgi:hypothetical protein